MHASSIHEPLFSAANKQKKLVMIVKAMLGLFFLVAVFRFVNTEDFLNTIKRVNWFYCMLSVLLSVLLVTASCWKWHIIMNAQSHEVRFVELLRIYYIGYYFTNLLPTSIGGDVVRAYYSGKRIGNAPHAVAGIFLERFTGLLYLLVLVLVAPLWISGYINHPAVKFTTAFAACLLCGFVVVCVCVSWRYKGSPEKLLREEAEDRVAAPGDSGRSAVMSKFLFFFNKGLDMVRRFIHGVMLLERKAATLFLISVATVVFYKLTWVNVYVSYLAFGVEPSISSIAAAVPIAMMLAMVPISLGNLGVTEGAFIFFLGLAGLDKSPTLAMALLLRFKLILLGMIGMSLFVRRKKD